MKRIFKLLAMVAAVAAIAALAPACTNDEPRQGKPFDELPVLQKSDILSFFLALPAEDLPERIGPTEARERYFKAFRDMSEFGALADGEGPEETALKTDNAVFWSDYLDMQDGYDFTGDETTPHPYANIYTYAGVQPGKVFGVVKTGAFVDGEDKADPVKCYWFELPSDKQPDGKLSPAKLYLTPKYTADDLTANALLTYGAPNLYYAVKNNKIAENYYDRGMDVMIEEVGKTDVRYEWNGVGFVRNNDSIIYCIYNYAFANMMLGDKVPFSVPGYTTNLITAGEFDSVFYLVKGGETEPTLIIHSGMDDDVTMIEVCKGPYCNPYGIYPGMLVSEFFETVNRIGARFSDYDAFYCNDEEDDEFVCIYCHFDEDFVYKVPKSMYVGGSEFASTARVSRVAIVNAMG